MEDPSTNDGAMDPLFSNRFLANAQSGLSLNGAGQEKYPAHGQQTDLSAVMSVPKFEPNTPQTTRFVDEDPYLDDDLLQDDLAGSYQYHLPKPVVSESTRQPYDQGSYTNLLRQSQDASGAMEGANYHAFSSRSSVDYSSYPESHSVPRALNGGVTGYSTGFQDEVDDDGLFIETMPAIANDRYVKRKYGSPMGSMGSVGSLGGSLGDSLGDSILSPHRSPHPLDPPPRRSPLYDDDHFPAQPYPSISVFRDGGVGVGRSYRHSPLAAHEDPKWNRAYSLSRNLDELGGQYPMRSSSFSRSPKEYGDGYGYMGDRLPPHRVSSMERMPTELGGPRGYGSRVLPHNHSFLDSVGFSDRDDLPLARARSMLYLGEDDDAELPLPLPHRNSKADLALLAQSALGPADDMTGAAGGGGPVRVQRVSEWSSDIRYEWYGWCEWCEWREWYGWCEWCEWREWHGWRGAGEGGEGLGAGVETVEQPAAARVQDVAAAGPGGGPREEARQVPVPVPRFREGRVLARRRVQVLPRSCEG